TPQLDNPTLRLILLPSGEDNLINFQVPPGNDFFVALPLFYLASRSLPLLHSQAEAGSKKIPN
ncbi:MAG: hypothetical protein ACYT04_93735, partial [Nostoc sp.]